MATHNLRMGGVMRCCIDTLEKHCAKPAIPEAQEGDILPCLYGSCSLVYRDGAWEWPGARFSPLPDNPHPLEVTRG